MSEGQEENEDEERRYAKVRMYYCTWYTVLYTQLGPWYHYYDHTRNALTSPA
jgi:hypothetical protein